MAGRVAVGERIAEDDFASWAVTLDLPVDVVRSLCATHVPLTEWIATRHRVAARPLLVGVHGAQGTGKSTLTWLVTRLLSKLHGLHAAGLSIDDLYLTVAERKALAREVHPLLRTRGVPGTHDVGLAHRVLDELLAQGGGEVALPRFDKATDDRSPVADWRRVRSPVDVVILEGWCVGTRPEGDAELAEPCNDLERQSDPDGRWRRYVNTQLAGPYAELFARLDALVMLEVPDMDCVRTWRKEQEHALSRRLRREGRPDTTLDDAAVERFVEHFERLTRAALIEMPQRADVRIGIDRGHRLTGTTYREQP